MGMVSLLEKLWLYQTCCRDSLIKKNYIMNGKCAVPVVISIFFLKIIVTITILMYTV